MIQATSTGLGPGADLPTRDFAGRPGPRPRASGPVWRIGDRNLVPDPFLVAGIVNVTPDSFYDGGRHDTPDAAVAHGLGLARDGADLVDVGGESTRPGSDPVSFDEELRRVLPVVRELVRAFADPVLAAGRDPAGDPNGASVFPPVVAVDTCKAACAAACLDAGAAIVNDVSACAWDPGLLDVLVQFRPGYVLMHSLGRPKTMQDRPAYRDVVEDVLAFFERRLSRLVAAGLPEEHVVLDPGIGFGKLLEHNLALLRALPRFAEFGRPVYLGLSNKALFQGLFGLAPGERGPATLAATALAGARGAHIHRVHDVAAARLGLRLAREFFPPEATRDAAGDRETGEDAP